MTQALLKLVMGMFLITLVVFSVAEHTTSKCFRNGESVSCEEIEKSLADEGLEILGTETNWMYVALVTAFLMLISHTAVEWLVAGGKDMFRFFWRGENPDEFKKEK